MFLCKFKQEQKPYNMYMHHERTMYLVAIVWDPMGVRQFWQNFEVCESIQVAEVEAEVAERNVADVDSHVGQRQGVNSKPL